MFSIYKCPVCNEELIREEKQYKCSKGHSFDICKKGYVNLLMVNKKKSKEPGDNKQMIKSRRDFLNKGFYKNLSDKLNNLILKYINEKTAAILDAGCGEGYYISNLKNSSLNKINFYGMDISKAAINLSSGRDKDIDFLVGSSFEIPIQDEKIDIVIRNFAPGDPKEFYRILKENGKLIIITPGTYHLYELKEVLYEKARKNEDKSDNILNFKSIHHEEVKYKIELNNNEDIKNLISMTPYYWSIKDEVRDNLDKIDNVNTTLHFNIDIYEKVKGEK